MIYVALLKCIASCFISSRDGNAAGLPSPDYVTNRFASKLQSKIVLYMRANIIRGSHVNFFNSYFQCNNN